MPTSYGFYLRELLDREALLPIVGVYDVFSASLAAQYYQGLFLSGFGVSASFYGLPDLEFTMLSDCRLLSQWLAYPMSWSQGTIPSAHVPLEKKS